MQCGGAFCIRSPAMQRDPEAARARTCVLVPSKCLRIGLLKTRERLQHPGLDALRCAYAWSAQVLTDGCWTSFDAATEGFDSVHVALVVGQGDRKTFAAAMGRLAALEIRSVAQVAQRTPAGVR